MRLSDFSAITAEPRYGVVFVRLEDVMYRMIFAFGNRQTAR